MLLRIVLMAIALAACSKAPAPDSEANGAVPANTSAPAAALSLTRLDCGDVKIKNFDTFFSDKPGLYESAPRDITDSCYLIRHGDQLLLWDTGVSGDLKGTSFDAGEIVLSLKRTLIEQLANVHVKPEDIDIVGISHDHADHTGQAGSFPNAKLIIGAADFDVAAKPTEQGGPSPITPWLKEGAHILKATADVDIFGDGSVVAMHLPGHTPDHMALLVNLKSGPVLLSGDLYHSLEAREKRGVPPFNTSRDQTLKSMDAFEAKAKTSGAKVIIQHEPRDIPKLPAFPAAAQ